MASPIDPYRVLGLNRDASLPEVKRAYRRLAKANHPDAAGPAALPRFLAIQAAYEQLAGTAAPPLTGRGTAQPQRPWDADPVRTDATRRAYSRTRRPEPDADGGEAGTARTRSRTRPAGARPGAPPGGRSASDSTAGRTRKAGSGRSTTQGPRGKATLGSTSYDGAEPGPFEPDWGGASWYGTTSGTYWTLNPKEYADPRKHGPEYQARARRAAGGRGAPGPGPSGSSGEPAAPQDAFEPPDWSSRANASRFRTVDDRDTDDGGTDHRGTDHRGTDHRGTDHRDTASRDASGASTWADHQPNARPSGASARGTVGDDLLDLGGAMSQLAGTLTNPRAGGLRGRALRALLGWLPIALGIAWIVGEASGCGRFAATCDPSVGPLTTAGQGILLAVLFLVPEVAALAAGAALIVLAAAVAASLILSATGAAADEASRRAALGGLLVVAWASGLLIAIVRRLRMSPGTTGPERTRPVS